MELLGGLLVLAVMAWVGLTICAGGLCADQTGQDAARPLPKAERPPAGEAPAIEAGGEVPNMTDVRPFRANLDGWRFRGGEEGVQLLG